MIAGEGTHTHRVRTLSDGTPVAGAYLELPCADPDCPLRAAVASRAVPCEIDILESGAQLHHVELHRAIDEMAMDVSVLREWDTKVIPFLEALSHRTYARHDSYHESYPFGYCSECEPSFRAKELLDSRRARDRKGAPASSTDGSVNSNGGARK